MRWAFIIAFPKPEVLVKADKHKWENFLHVHKLARPTAYLRRLEVLARARQFAGSAAAIRAKSKSAVARARQLQWLELKVKTQNKTGKMLTAFSRFKNLPEKSRRKTTGSVLHSATAALGMCVNLATACERERTCSFS